MKLQTTLAAAQAAALLTLAACAEPSTPTAAAGPGTTTPVPDLGDPPTMGDDQGHPCFFVWEELPFEDDSIIAHHILRYDAEVWVEPPYNVFSDDSSRQAVDLTIPPPPEDHYLDVEDDVIRWRCPGDTKPESSCFVVGFPTGFPTQMGKVFRRDFSVRSPRLARLPL